MRRWRRSRARAAAPVGDDAVRLSGRVDLVWQGLACWANAQQAAGCETSCVDALAQIGAQCNCTGTTCTKVVTYSLTAGKYVASDVVANQDDCGLAGSVESADYELILQVDELNDIMELQADIYGGIFFDGEVMNDHGVLAPTQMSAGVGSTVVVTVVANDRFAVDATIEGIGGCRSELHLTLTAN